MIIFLTVLDIRVLGLKPIGIVVGGYSAKMLKVPGK